MDLGAGVTGVVAGIQAALKGGHTWGRPRRLCQHVACTPGTPDALARPPGTGACAVGRQVPTCDGGWRQGCAGQCVRQGRATASTSVQGRQRGWRLGVAAGTWPHSLGWTWSADLCRVDVDGALAEPRAAGGLPTRQATAPPGGSGLRANLPWVAGRASLLGSGWHTLACRPKSWSKNCFYISNMVLKKSRATFCDK